MGIYSDSSMQMATMLKINTTLNNVLKVTKKKKLGHMAEFFFPMELKESE